MRALVKTQFTSPRSARGPATPACMALSPASWSRRDPSGVGVSRFLAGHPLPDADEGSAEGHAYPTRSRREALDQGKLSRLGTRVGDALSRDELIQVGVHGRLLPSDDVRASAVPSPAPGLTHICANGV